MRAPLPDCLRFFLHERLLKRAKRDTLRDTLREWRADAGAQQAFKAREKALRAWFATRAAEATLDRKKKATVLGMEVFLREMEARKVVGDRQVAPVPAVTGVVLPTVHTNLSVLDVKGAFACCQVATSARDLA